MKCGLTIRPDLVKRVDFDLVECLKCGESSPGAKERWHSHIRPGIAIGGG